MLAGILARGHVLLEDVPGVGKTLTARSFAQALGIGFRRVQFTPDLLPSDVTGSYVFDQRTAEFVFRPGPIFTGLLLADEINRTPPKTQAALLEAMQERQVTVEGTTFPLDAPFHVLATANPVEYEGTYPLPEAQLDRFLLRVAVRLPDGRGGVGRAHPAHRPAPGGAGGRRRSPTPPGSSRLQRACEAVEVDPSVGRYCVELSTATRRHRQVLIGASPRGSLALLLTARAYAVIDGRDFVLPEDVKAVAVAALAHRITVKPELWLRDVDGALGRGRRAGVDGHAADRAPDRAVTRPWPRRRAGVPTHAHLRAVGAGRGRASLIAVLARRADVAVLGVPVRRRRGVGRPPPAPSRADGRRSRLAEATVFEGQVTTDAP